VKKGCGLTLVLWLALVGAYGYVAFQKIHELFPSAMIGVLGGTFASALVGSFIGLFTGASDRAALRRAMNGDAMRDGRLEAASGQIRPTGAPLESPFSGRPCVAYEYDVKQPDAGASEFAGFALAPCAIQTIRGPVRVFGWAMLDSFSQTDSNAIDRARGAAILRTAAFEKLGVTTILSVMGELMADQDGAIRKDLRVDGDVAALQGDGALRGRAIQERIVPVDAMVTMLGRWSEARQGFAPGGAVSINRMFPADLEATRKTVGGNAVKTFAIGLVFFLALHAILVPMFLLAPGAKSSESAVPSSVLDDRDCDRQKAALAAGADPNEIGRDGLTPLMNAAREGDGACVKNLLGAGAKLEVADVRGDTAMAQAITAGRDDNVEILRAAGAKDFRITAAAGRPVTADSAPVVAVKEYIAAVHRADFESMARLKIGSSIKVMEGRRDDLAFWQSLRPKDADLLEGWMTDDAATLVVRGTTTKGDRRINYHVVRRPDGWRILREWFPD
jgi:hypothetical protein